MSDAAVPSITDALRRLIAIALRDTGQSNRVASFLLAWHNAEENGGWDPTDLWMLDPEIRTDVLFVVGWVAENSTYPDDLGFKHQMKQIWKHWRSGNR